MATTAILMAPAGMGTKKMVITEVAAISSRIEDRRAIIQETGAEIMAAPARIRLQVLRKG